MKLIHQRSKGILTTGFSQFVPSEAHTRKAEIRKSSVISFRMTITRAKLVYQRQRSTELMPKDGKTLEDSIWPFYVGVHSVESRIETEAELNS